MTLKKILNILGKKRATVIAGCGSSAAWHWYQTGKKQKIPETQCLIAWCDHLKLSDAELGELVRDAHRRRVEIMEELAEEDRMHIRPRSVLRRDLAREIAEQIKGDVQEHDEQDLEALKRKEEYLLEEARRSRLDDYRKQLETLRRKNGNH